MTEKRHRRQLSEVEEQRQRAEHALGDLADQAVVHVVEIQALTTRYVEMKAALTEAIGLVDWIRGGGRNDAWTPAQTQRLDEWRELTKGNHAPRV